MDWTLLGYWAGVALNLTGAGCAGWALLLSHERHGVGSLDPAIAALVRWPRALWRKITGHEPEVHRVVASASAHATLTAEGRGYAGPPTGATTDVLVAWLIDRVELLRREAAEDRDTARRQTADVGARLSEHAQRSEQRLSEREAEVRDVGAGKGTAHWQLRGLLLVAVGTLLVAVTSGPA